jgi:hypothetical protein
VEGGVTVAGDAPIDMVNPRGQLRGDALRRTGRGLPFARNIAGNGIIQGQSGTVLPFAASQFVFCFVYGNQRIELPDNTEVDGFSFDTVQVDTASFFNPATPKVLNFPQQGWYDVGASLEITNMPTISATKVWQFQWGTYSPANAFPFDYDEFPCFTGVNFIGGVTNGLYYANAGDTVGMWAKQNCGVTIEIVSDDDDAGAYMMWARFLGNG